MARYFKNSSWGNAYVQRDLRDALSEFAAGARTAFNAEVVGVTGTTDAANAFNGINVGGVNYVNINGTVSFINTVGHEIYHELERNNPELHQWFVAQARQYYQNFDEYQERLNKLVGKNEAPYTKEQAESELLADFTGDAMADPEFVAQLAEANPSKFRQLLRSVIGWLKVVGARLKGNGSSKYISDVEAMRKHLAKALLAYSRRNSAD